MQLFSSPSRRLWLPSIFLVHVPEMEGREQRGSKKGKIKAALLLPYFFFGRSLPNRIDLIREEHKNESSFFGHVASKFDLLRGRHLFHPGLWSAGGGRANLRHGLGALPLFCPSWYASARAPSRHVAILRPTPILQRPTSSEQERETLGGRFVRQ